MRFLYFILIPIFLLFSTCKKEAPLAKGQMRVTVDGQKILLGFNGKVTVGSDTVARFFAANSPSDKLFRMMTISVKSFSGPTEYTNADFYPNRVIIQYTEGNASFSSHYLGNPLGEAKITVKEWNQGERTAKGEFSGILKGIYGNLNHRKLEDGEFFLSISQ